jgi:alpha-beta hydrolase superfamily lysophospholipase
MAKKWTWAAGALVIVGALVLAVMFYPPLRSATQRLWEGPPQATGGAPTAISTANLSDSGAGSLVSAMTMPGITETTQGRRLRAGRVVYRSTDGDTGRQTVVSGSVFTPLGDPPDGGWPVVSYGHGTTGIDPSCGPSLSNTLLGQLELVAGLVNAGYAVAFTDYQGLGHDGAPAYLDSRTAAFNMIDAVRALRATFPGVSKRWGAFGGSQGGGASWSADEQAHTYAPELELVGAVAVSPGADISGYVDKAQAGTLTSDQKAVMQLFVESLARRYPDFNRDDYRRGDVARDWNTLSACTGPLVAGRTAAIDAIGPFDLAPSTPEAADLLRKKFQQWALPQQPLSAPLSVAYGGKDTFIDHQWTADAIQRACALGDTLDIRFGPDYKHSEADFPAEVTWLADRFAGKPAHNDCS